MKAASQLGCKLLKVAALVLLSSLLFVNLAFGSAGSTTLTANLSNPAVWNLVWRDEFDGPNGSGVDSTKWVTETGGSGWGNNELEYYTHRLLNAHIENGALVIKALQETYTGPDGVTRNYTSARLKTQGKFSLTYGRIEARLKIPYGLGMWPAFWMLGTDIGQVGWPACGEMDIMENIGREPSMVHGTIHGPGYSGGNGLGGSYSLSNGRRLADDFHTFAIEWEPNVIRFYVDGLLYKTRTPADLPANSSWVFAHPFFILLNVAVGGSWPGNPDASTVFPQTMTVDYVRVYQRSTPSSSALLLSRTS
jgi:beta-glucanase (GH16 family)